VRLLIGAQYRKRVGEYRIIFEADLAARSIRVKNISRRTTTTYRRRR
jgi:mRNA-degrading endonuclease RelE of RelBE toxin-antitoxin system